MALESLAQPSEVSTGLLLLIGMIYLITGYIAIRLYSAVSLVTWGMTFIAFIFTILVDLDFRIVWIALILTVIIEMISVIVYTRY